MSDYRKKTRAGQPKTSATRQSPAQTAFADSEERLRAILQTAVEGIITIDERGIIESMNPAAEKTFGFKTAEVLGKNVNMLMPAPDRDRHDSYLANYKRTGKAKIIGIGREVVGRRKDGTLFPMDLAVSEVRLAHRRLFTGFVRDITERKRAEEKVAALARTLAERLDQERQLIQLQKEILEISDREQQRIGQDLHDGLCQQLAGIELMSQVLEQKLAAKSKPDAARAGEIARHVRDAISQTRRVARGLSPVTVEFEGLMSGLQELAANTEHLFGVRCRFVCEQPVTVGDLAVASHLYRIAQEAVSNAIKHGKAAEVVIDLKAEGERIVLAVSDNGSGIRKAPPRRQGMGLRIMQYRASRIGGRLVIGNNPDRGANVTCSAPHRAGRGSGSAK